MSYKTIYLCANDEEFNKRIIGCIAQEQLSRDEVVSPGPIVSIMKWAVSSVSDVEGAYAYALNSNNPNPGGDETVITDGMILASVQAHWPSS